MKVKNIIFMLVLLAGMGTANAGTIKGKLITITFKYKFIHAAEGKEINTRLKIYVDDAVKGVSLAKMETESNTVTIEIPTGKHKLRAVIESEFEGKWEEHTVANEYSIDCVYLSETDFTKHVRVDIIFDLEKGTIVKSEQTKSTSFNSPF
jgi:citrate lyase beta subunit